MTRRRATFGPLVAGIDLATSEARAVICDPEGTVVGRGASPLRAVSRPRPGWAEQDAGSWWPAVADALRQATSQVASEAIDAVAVAGTSGTVVAVDRRGAPLGPALMYDDRRAGAEAAVAGAAGAARLERLGIAITPSSGLAKAGWLAHQMGRRQWRLCHTADLVGWWLASAPVALDWSHALKSGYDAIAGEWALECFEALGVDDAVLPDVAAPTTVAGVVSRAAAAATGLPAGCCIRLGMTDGCAAQLAAGASEVGTFVTVLGTTLVVKGVASAPVRDLSGAVYSHRHPDGAWLPGGASNTGGEALAAWGSNRLAELDEAAAARGPSSVTAWPLRRAGERFPFLCAKAEGFVDGEPEDEVDAYRAQLEGLAYLERLAYERLAELGASRTRPVLTAGGGARSHTWSRVRAGVLGDAVGVVAGAGSALGAAMLASSGGVHRDLSAATAAMAPSPLMIDPDRRERAALERGYGRFLEALSRRGWYRRGTTAPPDRGVVSVAPG